MSECEKSISSPIYELDIINDPQAQGRTVTVDNCEALFEKRKKGSSLPYKNSEGKFVLSDKDFNMCEAQIKNARKKYKMVKADCSKEGGMRKRRKSRRTKRKRKSLKKNKRTKRRSSKKSRRTRRR